MHSGDKRAVLTLITCMCFVERRRRFDINAAYGGPKVTVLCDVPRSDPIFHTPDLRLKVEFFDDRLFLTDMGGMDNCKLVAVVRSCCVVGGVHGGVVADVGSQLEVIREREHLSDLIRTETSYEYSIDDILQPDISVSRNGVYLPYLMVEVAVSETLAHATRKAKKYFQLDTSEVQVVLVISVGRFVQGDETSLKSLKALVFRRDDVEHPTVTSFMRGENYSSLALEGPYVLDLEKVRMSVYDEISQPPPPKK